MTKARVLALICIAIAFCALYSPIKEILTPSWSEWHEPDHIMAGLHSEYQATYGTILRTQGYCWIGRSRHIYQGPTLTMWSGGPSAYAPTRSLSGSEVLDLCSKHLSKSPPPGYPWPPMEIRSPSFIIESILGAAR